MGLSWGCHGVAKGLPWRWQAARTPRPERAMVPRGESPNFGRMVRMNRDTIGGGAGALMRRSFNKGLGAAALVAAGALAACTSSVPDFTQFKLPQPRNFLPANSGTYVPPASAKDYKPVAPADLVDAQGACAGMAPAPAATQGSDASGPPAQPAAPAAPAAAVGLDMSECDVVRALGSPQSVNLSSNERGDRKVVMVYMGSERAGTYEFTRGRLTSLERGPEPPPPPKPEKPAKKKKPATVKKDNRQPPPAT